jgi:uncharacterized protein
MNWIGLVLGGAFGFLIAAAGFADYDVIHNGLLLRDWHMYLTMGSAVVTAMPILWLLQRRRWRTPLGGEMALQQQAPGRRHVLGGVVFGAGWAVTGTCPAPALAMTAGGGVLGIFVIAGLFTGLMLRDRTERLRERIKPAQPEPSSRPSGSRSLKPATEP